MAYEEKRSYDEEESGYSIFKLIKILAKKWWVIFLLTVVFTVAGFGVAKLTYVPQYTSRLIINISNKDEAIAGEAAKYTTASDAQASAVIANNFKIIIQQGDDFIIAVRDAVNAKTGVEYSKKELRSVIGVETVTDTTMLKISVTTGDPELSYAITTAIQSVYTPITKEAFPNANFTVADNATASELQGDSSTLLYTAAGFILGAGIAVLILFVSGMLKNTVLTSDDIKKNFNVNIIASVAKIKSKKNERKRLLITDKNVGLPFIETFKLIRTKIENVKLKKGYSVFAVTSSTESEGKTTCSANIALSLAKSGKSVLLIDADLRKPAVYKTLGISIDDSDLGVYDIVSGAKPFEEAVKYVEKYNLYLLISAVPVTDPSEVLASRKMEAIITEARKSFDYVIVDCPPAGVVADAAIVSNYTDSIIFVTAENKVSVPQVEYALSDLMTTKAEILGVIYNYAEGGLISSGSGKSGGYGYGYGGYGSYYGSHYGSSYYGTSSSKHKKHK